MNTKLNSWSMPNVILSCMVAICGLTTTSKAVEASRTMRIVAFGDSTTAPRVVEGKELAVYADLLAEDAKLRERGVKIINAGVPGDTTQDARARFDRDVLGNQPSVVIIQFGINDAAVDVWKNPPATEPRVPLAQFRANLTYFAFELRRHGIQTVLMTPNPTCWTDKLRSLYGKPPYAVNDLDGFNVLLKTYAQAVREVAKKSGVPLIDVYAAFQAHGNETNHSVDDLLLDGMHPNAKGHRLIADLLERRLASMRFDPPHAMPAAKTKTTPSGIEIDARATWMADLPAGPFVRLSDGRLLTVDSEQCLVSPDDGKHWQAHAMFKDPSKFTIRPERALIRTRKGVVILAFTNDREKHWTWNNKLHDAPGATLPTYVMRSVDGGLKWEAPQKLHEDWTGAVRDILETKSGRVIFTTMKMLHHPGRHAVLTYCSDDQGRTWKASNVIDLGGEGTHGGVMEATIVELKDGRLLMLLRTNWMRFWRAESWDGGLTWHPLGPSNIPASSSPGMLKRLDDGRIVLIWNRPFPEGKESYPLHGGGGILSATPADWYRSELSMTFSDDECKTWSQPVVIARKPDARLAYPYMFEASPGVLWITTMQGGVRLKLREADFIN